MSNEDQKLTEDTCHTTLPQHPLQHKQHKHRKTEAETLRHEAQSAYAIDPLKLSGRRTKTLHAIEDVTLSSGEQTLDRTLTSKSTLPSLIATQSTTIASEQEIALELEQDRLDDEERSLYTLHPGQTDPTRQSPTRELFEYAYKNFLDREVRRFLTEVQPWIQFRRKCNRIDFSLPILDYDGNIVPDITDSTPEHLDTLPANVKRIQIVSLPQHIPKQTQPVITPTIPKDNTKSDSSQSQTTPKTTTGTDQTGDNTDPTKDPTPPSSDHTPTLSRSSSADSDMPNLKERAVFFPKQEFDGTDKTLTQTHLQSFEDFVKQQKFADDTEKMTYFEMTLRGLARNWYDSTTFTDYNDMISKFRKRFNKFGPNPRDWLRAWIDLKFDPQTDDIDQYVQTIKDLAELLSYPPEQTLQVFRMSMPESVELRIKDMATLDNAVKEAKECIEILKNSITTRISKLTIAQSPPRQKSQSRSPSPGPSHARPAIRSSRPPNRRQNTFNPNSFQGFRQYPGSSNTPQRRTFRPRSRSLPSLRFQSNSRNRIY